MANFFLPREPAQPSAVLALTKLALSIRELERAEKQVAEPTDAQKETGNYAKGHVVFQGLPITVETAKGQWRRGVGKDGKPWQIRLSASYGYFKRTVSEADGDHIDVFLSDRHLDSQIVFVVNQVDPDTLKFDEVKCILGHISEQDARKAYLANYAPGWKGLGSVVAMTLPQFKRWLKHGDTSKPVTDDWEKTGAARTSAASGVPSLAPDERTLSQPEEQAVLLLRGQGDPSLCKLAEELLGVLYRHGTEAVGGNPGEKEKPPRIQPEQLCLGNQGPTSEKQAQQSVDTVSRATAGAGGLGSRDRRIGVSSPQQNLPVRVVNPAGTDDSGRQAQTDSYTPDVLRKDTDHGGMVERPGTAQEHDPPADSQRMVYRRGTRKAAEIDAEILQALCLLEEEDRDQTKTAVEGRPFTVAVDLDGTLAEQEEPFDAESIGDPRPHARRLLRLLRRRKARVIIFTVRGSKKLVADWFAEHDLPYDYINENPDQPADASGKVLADVYLDDRALNATDLVRAIRSLEKRLAA